MANITQAQIGSTRIELVQGDITRQTVDAIVNAANSALSGGGGVDGAIHRAAGPQLLAECRTLGRCPTGEARITGGYNLPAKHIIHAVGPVYTPHDDAVPQLLASAHTNSLRLAHDHSLKRIAFPAISTGAYGYPLAKAARIAFETVMDYIREHQPEFELVRFVLFDFAALSAFSRALNELIQANGHVKAN